MNYELALQLKNAGFPQHIEKVISAEEVNPRNVPYYNHRVFDLSLMGYPKEESDYYTQGKWRPAHYFSRKYIDSDECDILYFPTLSELIEACGDNFGALTQYDREKGEGWFVSGHKIIWDSDEINGYICVNGLTSEEAVANLYLAINQK